MKNLLSQTPLYVWPLFIYFMYLGITRTKKHSMSLQKALIIPALFVGSILFRLSKRSYLYDTEVGTILLLGVAIGVVTSRLIFLRQKPVIQKGTVTLNGTRSFLTLLLVIFAIKYYLGVQLALDPLAPHNFFYRTLDLFSLGYAAGYFGFRLCYFLRHIKK